MLRFRDWSINWKIGFMFFIMFIFILINFLLNIFARQDELHSQISIASQNGLLAQKIAVYSEAIGGGEIDLNDKVSKAIELHDAGFQALKNGGTLSGDKDGERISGIGNEMPDEFSKVELVWKDYKDNASRLISGNSDNQSQGRQFIYQHADEMVQADQALVQAIISWGNQKDKRDNNFFLGLFVLNVIIILICMNVVNRYVSVPVKNVLPFFMEMSNGILGEKITVAANDEIGTLTGSFNRMNDNLARVVRDITMGADHIVEGSAQISDASQMLSQGASEQAASAEQVTSSIEQMAASIQQNADNAKESDIAFNRAESRIHEMASSSKETLEAIRNITDKIAIINDIAFQTNILALNAAVEASRAGDQGRGFAVVASEVRKLAERSKVAADSIMALSHTTLNSTENTEKLAVELAGEFAKSARMIREIAASSVELTAGADQINTAVQQMNQVTQQNAAASEQLATSAEEFSSQAEQLKDTIGYFQIGTAGKRTGSKREGARLIEWGPRYFIGISEIDSQHKVLVDLINKLFAAFGSDKNRREIKKVLEELVEYTVYHFGNEEKYFQKFGYKETPAHLDQHHKFVDRIKKFASEFESGDATVSMEIINFLKDWLINHILKTDKKYVNFFKSHGIK